MTYEGHNGEVFKEILTQPGNGVQWLKEVKIKTNPGVMVHTCHPSTQQAEAGRLQVQGQPGLHSELRPGLAI
jgi:hypothetical protein